MARAWPVPPRDHTVHCIGDPHFGANLPAQATMEGGRGAKVLDDYLSPLQIVPAAHLILGDLVNDATPAQDAAALAWTAQFPSPVHITLGGHETWQNIRNPAQAAAALGLPGVNYTVDLGFARFVSLGFDATDAFGSMLRVASGAGGCLDWLAATLLFDTSTPTLIGRHAPLYNTVGRTGPTTEYRSIDGGFSGPRDSELRAIIGAVPNVKAFITGHTHSPIITPEIITREVIGASTLAAVNASSMSYVHNTGVTPVEPLNSVYLTYLPGSPPRVQVRFRSHGGRQWTGGGTDRARMIEVEL